MTARSEGRQNSSRGVIRNARLLRASERSTGPIFFLEPSERTRRYLGSSPRFSCIHLTNAPASFIGGAASQLYGLGTVACALNGSATPAAAAADNVKKVRRCIFCCPCAYRSVRQSGGSCTAITLPQIPIPEKRPNER